MTEITAGAMFAVPYPFVRDVFESWDADGPVRTVTWKPGVRNVLVPPDDCEAVADGVGAQILTVVSVHKPGRYPARVFYERQWSSPAETMFGKRKCLIKTQQAFRRVIAGYWHEYRLASPEETAAHVEWLFR